MRLIDTDKIHRSRAKITEGSKSFYKEWFSASAIDNAPTVEAIPIEWLHSIMERQLIFAMESEMEGTTTVQDGVIHCVSGALACQVVANVIELWEKENETE